MTCQHISCMLYGMGLRARLLAVQIAEELRASLVKSEFHEHKIIFKKILDKYDKI